MTRECCGFEGQREGGGVWRHMALGGATWKGEDQRPIWFIQSSRVVMRSRTELVNKLILSPASVTLEFIFRSSIGGPHWESWLYREWKWLQKWNNVWFYFNSSFRSYILLQISYSEIRDLFECMHKIIYFDIFAFISLRNLQAEI